MSCPICKKETGDNAICPHCGIAIISSKSDTSESFRQFDSNHFEILRQCSLSDYMRARIMLIIVLTIGCLFLVNLAVIVAYHRLIHSTTIVLSTFLVLTSIIGLLIICLSLLVATAIRYHRQKPITECKIALIAKENSNRFYIYVKNTVYVCAYLKPFCCKNNDNQILGIYRENTLCYPNLDEISNELIEKV